MRKYGMYFILYLSVNKSYETEMTNCFILHLLMGENILKNIKKVPEILFVN